CQQENTIPPSF
nr:immunoglobulin light chain junction region [Macaca mulatta]